MLRLFVGISLPPEARTDLARLCGGLPGAKWVPRDNLHVSLRFIGEVGGGDAEDIHVALERIRAAPFQLKLAGLGCFESGRRIHTLWAGLDKEEGLVRLQDKVETALVRTGLDPERRKFKPHVTLARFRNGANYRIGPFIEDNNRFAMLPFPVDRFTLFRSHLGGEAPHYEPLAEYPLTS